MLVDHGCVRVRAGRPGQDDWSFAMPVWPRPRLPTLQIGRQVPGFDGRSNVFESDDSEVNEWRLQMTLPAVSFEEYDPNYPAAFARLAESIRTAMPQAAVEHVGSTSVPGLGGRPVLDVVIASAAAERESWAAALRALGFADAPFTWIKPMLTGAVDYAGRTYRVLIYLVAKDHEVFRGWVALRDHLRASPDEAHRYAAIKRKAIAEGRTAPWDYQQAKTPYLQDLARRLPPSAEQIK